VSANSLHGLPLAMQSDNAAVDELNDEMWSIWMEGSAAYWAEKDALSSRDRETAQSSVPQAPDSSQ
jgi:hypothetical protein